MIGNDVYEVNSEGDTITRKIGGNGHPVISPEMFVDIAKDRVDAAINLIEEAIKLIQEKEIKTDADNKKLTDLNEQLVALNFIKDNIGRFFDTKFEKEFKDIKKKRFIDTKGLKEIPGIEEKQKKAFLFDLETKYQKAFDELYDHNMGKLKQVSVLIAHYVDSKKSAEKVLKQINNETKLMRLKRKRPIQHNHYEVPDVAKGHLEVKSSHIPEGELITTQKKLHKEVFNEDPPKGNYTIPSTIRNKNQVGQVNSICSKIVVNAKKVFEGWHHGSPCVLKIEDEAERQYRTMQNVRQTLAVAAKRKLRSIDREVERLDKKIPILDEKVPKLEKKVRILERKVNKRVITGDELKKLDEIKKRLSEIEKRRQELKERLMELKEIQAGTRPLPLDHAAMSLLSPVVDDNPLLITRLVDPMKQYRQVNDSRLAYWSLHGREVPLEIPGEESPKTLNIILDSTFMSMGVNAARGMGTLEAQRLVQRINNRGLNNMVKGFFNRLPLKAKYDEALRDIINTLEGTEEDEKIQRNLNKIKQYEKASKVKLHNAYKTLEYCNTSLHDKRYQLKEKQEEFKKEYRKLLPNQLMELGLQGKMPPPLKRIQDKISELESEIKNYKLTRKQAIKTIDKHEKVLDVHYHNLAIVREKAYRKALREDLKDQLGELGNQLSKASNKLKESQEELKNCKKVPLQKEKAIKLRKEIKELKASIENYKKIHLFVDLLDTYYNQPQPGLERFLKSKYLNHTKNKLEKALSKETSPKEKTRLTHEIDKIEKKIDALNKGNYRFQARFALLAQHMDTFIEWFCKSGEDRTGLLNEHIEAFCIFIEKHGYPPKWDSPKDSERFHEILPLVHNGAPNRESNGYNDGAKGMKVKKEDFFVMKSETYYTDNQMGKVASNSIKIGKHEKRLLYEAEKTLKTIKSPQSIVTEREKQLSRTFTPARKNQEAQDKMERESSSVVPAPPDSTGGLNKKGI